MEKSNFKLRAVPKFLWEEMVKIAAQNNHITNFRKLSSGQIMWNSNISRAGINYQSSSYSKGLSLSTVSFKYKFSSTILGANKEHFSYLNGTEN